MHTLRKWLGPLVALVATAMTQAFAVPVNCASGVIVPQEVAMELFHAAPAAPSVVGLGMVGFDSNGVVDTPVHIDRGFDSHLVTKVTAVISDYAPPCLGQIQRTGSDIDSTPATPVTISGNTREELSLNVSAIGGIGSGVTMGLVPSLGASFGLNSGASSGYEPVLAIPLAASGATFSG